MHQEMGSKKGLLQFLKYCIRSEGLESGRSGEIALGSRVPMDVFALMRFTSSTPRMKDSFEGGPLNFGALDKMELRI